MIDDKGAVREVAQKPHFRFDTKTSAYEVSNLADHERRDDQWADVMREQAQTSFMVCVVSVDVRVKRSGIDDQRSYDRTSAARISSIRSDTSLRPLRPAFAAPSRRVFSPPVR